MPTYEYIREDGSVFEMMQSINAEPLKCCPETGQKVRRLITGGGGVVYKGDGWYITDYKNKDRTNGTDKAENPTNGHAENGKSAAEKGGNGVQEKDPGKQTSGSKNNAANRNTGGDDKAGGR